MILICSNEIHRTWEDYTLRFSYRMIAKVRASSILKLLLKCCGEGNINGRVNILYSVTDANLNSASVENHFIKMRSGTRTMLWLPWFGTIILVFRLEWCYKACALLFRTSCQYPLCLTDIKLLVKFNKRMASINLACISQKLIWNILMLCLWRYC